MREDLPRVESVEPAAEGDAGPVPV